MKLKELRKENKKSQSDIANFLNIAQTTYSGYEVGISEPSIETLCKLADFYHVSLDYLVGREFAYDVGYLNDNEKAMLAMFRRLNENNQAKLNKEAVDILIKQK